MWVFDRQTLRFLAVNDAAIHQYGFSEQEFLSMTVAEIRPDEDVAAFMEDVTQRKEGLQDPGIWRHRRKDGQAIDVEIICHSLEFRGIDAMLVCAHDITERKWAEQMLENSENKYRVLFEESAENKYRVLFEESADAHFLISDMELLDWNSAALELFGYSAGDRMPHPATLSPPLQPDGTPSAVAAPRKIAAALQNGRERFEWLHQRKDGSVFPAEVLVTALTLSGRQVLLSTVRDILERKQAEEALLFKTALLEGQTETTLDGILAVDERDHVVLANKQFGLQFEIPDEVLALRDDRALRGYMIDHVLDPDTFLERIALLSSRRDKRSRDEVRLKNGKIFDRYCAPLVDSKGQYRGRICYHRDITDHKASESRIQFLAYYDALTGLPNRTLMQDRLESALADARRRNEKVGLLFLDLDHFKIYNDSLGHGFGDLLLKEVADRLKASAREQDTVARIGGDEFLVVLTGLEAATDAAAAAKRIMNTMSGEFTVQGRPVTITCSLGISIFPEHGLNRETLIKNADAAMYSAKEEGRNKFRFFSREMHAQAVERLTLENDMRLALDRGEFFLVYQPQIEIESGKVTGVEALIRWRHPEIGLIPPDRFISIAEASGLILPIGEWVLRTAGAQARSWQLAGLPEVPVAVNVSAVQFRQEGFADVIRRVLLDTGLPSQDLELELTEGVLLSNGVGTLSILQEMKEMGLKLAIDDFGTGYSSLSYLKHFPVDKIKIDRSLIQDLAVDPGDAAITAAIISMAKSLRLKVVAEGVETEEQLSFLREHQCDEVQGYYFSKPVRAEEVSEKIQMGWGIRKSCD